LINNLAAETELIYNMARVEQEPLLALQSARAYSTQYLKTVGSLVAINQYFIDHKIKFDGQSPQILISF